MTDNQNDQQDGQTGGALVPSGKRSVAPPKAQLNADGQGVMAIVPRSIEEASRYAQGLIFADQVPDAFREGGRKANPANASLVMMGVLKSLEIGLPPQTGLAFILPLNGRFNVWGDGAWALVQRAERLRTHTVEWFGPEFDRDLTPLDKWPNGYGVRVSLWRRGQDDPYVGEYTVGDARRAGLWNNTYKKPWITDPRRMLFNRARAFPMRDGFADSLFGLGIAEENHPDYSNVPQRGSARQIDNSALDDDLPALPAGRDPDAPGAQDLARQAEAYEAGLAMISTLEELADYQVAPDHTRLFQTAQQEDEGLHRQLIIANARRFQEIEQAERNAERIAADQREEARRASGDEPTTDQKGDLFAGKD